jgi:hypothetical protein
MDYQQRKIKGYRELNEGEIGLMNRVESVGAILADLIDDINRSGITVDSKWVYVGKIQLQQGLMALTRAVAKPNFF